MYPFLTMNDHTEIVYSAPSRNGAGRLRKMEKRTADAVRPKICIMI